jgi:hypothetical protein
MSDDGCYFDTLDRFGVWNRHAARHPDREAALKDAVLMGGQEIGLGMAPRVVEVCSGCNRPAEGNERAKEDDDGGA